jgi:tryptophan-rich sensory protein
MIWLKLVASLLIAFAAAAIGSIATTKNIPTWYAGLDKPFFNPPNWLFGPVWTVLYTFIGISLWRIWITETTIAKRGLYRLFGVQILLNTAWSLVFFGTHLVWLALAVIIALLISIILMIVRYKAVSRLASYLLIPYAAWVTFATCLNLGIALLN